MIKNSLKDKRVLITGGTSGLGKSLATKFSEEGSDVTIIGKNGNGKIFGALNYVYCDLSDLKSVMEVGSDFSRDSKKFDILVNNAGILSPPTFTETGDGFELSYQINFLSHVLLTRLLLKNEVLNSPTIVNTSSPIYTRGNLDHASNSSDTYTVLQAYANSKLYQAMFSELLATEGIRGFAINPGTFSSGIYRSQKGWFKGMYKIAAPFMVSADHVASKFIKIIRDGQFSNGSVINKNGSQKMITKFSSLEKEVFWETTEKHLGGFL